MEAGAGRRAGGEGPPIYLRCAAVDYGAGILGTIALLMGLLEPDAGRVMVGGSPVEFRSRRDAIRRGVGFIQQEFSL